jgi:hypothetical protein
MTAISTLPKQEQRAAKTQGTTALTIGLATASARGLPRLAPRPGPGLQRCRSLLGDRAWSKGMTAISTLPKQEQRAAKTQGTTALTIGLTTASARWSRWTFLTLFACLFDKIFVAFLLYITIKGMLE